MSTAMPHDPVRKKMIRAHLKEQEDAAGGRDGLPKEKLIVKGKAEREPVYKLSLDDLAFNKANGRIKAEVLEKEAELTITEAGGCGRSKNNQNNPSFDT